MVSATTCAISSEWICQVTRRAEPEHSFHLDDHYFLQMQSIGHTYCLMSREEASEESPTDDLELLQSKIQAETFNMCHHLLSNAAGFRPWMFYLLGVLETIQVLWFSFHNRLTFQVNSLGVPAVKTGTASCLCSPQLSQHRCYFRVVPIGQDSHLNSW